MIHAATNEFWECYEKLPLAAQKLTDSNFSTIKQYPNHPLLRLLKIDDFVSMRVGSRHRALAVQQNDTLLWFWIGTYKQYKKLVD